MPSKEQKESVAREKEGQEQAIRDKEKADAASEQETPAPLNPDAKKIEAGKKKVQELEDKEEKLVAELFEVRQEKSRAIRAIQGSTKQATLGQCREQMKKIHPSAQPATMARTNPQAHPMLPGALNEDELKAQKKK